VRREVFIFPAGTRFDGAAAPVCKASDLELELIGKSACPAAAWVGRGFGDTFMTGWPGDGEKPFVMNAWNDGAGLVLLAGPKQYPIRFAGRAHWRGRVGPQAAPPLAPNPSPAPNRVIADRPWNIHRGRGYCACRRSVGCSPEMRRLLLVATAFLVFSAGPAAAAPLTWDHPVHMDRLQPFGSSSAVFSVSCAGTALCVALGGSEGYATVSKNPASDSPTWSIPRAPSDDGHGGREVSCPSASLCVAIDGAGKVRTTANPGAESPVWTTTTVPFPPGDGNLQHVSCPTTSFCAVNDLAGYVYASNNPGAASPTWVATAAPVGPGLMTCASSALCIATDHKDCVRISPHPGAATPVWSAPVDITPGTNWLDAISCPTVTFCLAGSTDGLAYRSVNPTAASPTWTEITTRAGYHVRGLACPTANMCTASGNDGAITSTNPGAATPVWRFRTFPVQLHSLACGTASFCLVAFLNDPRAFVTRDASLPSPSPNWSAIGQIWGTNTLSSAACPGESLCLAGDNAGRILSTTNPTALGPKWRATTLPGAGGVVGLECPATSLCVAAGQNHRAAVSHNPAAATPDWVFTPAGPPFNPRDLSCPTVDRCVAVDSNNSAAVLDDVSKIGTIDDPAPVWRSAKQVDGASGLSALSCPTATHCSAVDSAGSVLTTTDVTAGDPVWDKATPPLGGLLLADVSCPSVGLCVVVDGFGGNLAWSTNPFAAAPVWNGPVNQVGHPIACSSTTFCVAGFGWFVRTSTAPGTWSGPVPVMSRLSNITAVACAGDRLCLLGNGLGDVAFGVAVPQNRTVPTVTGKAAVGSTLTAARGTWTGTPTTTLQWVRCDAAGGKCAAVGGATGSSYRVSAADVGRTLRVVEVARNAGGRATAASAKTAVVPPVMTKVLLRKALRARFSFTFRTPVAGTLVVRWHSLKTKKKAILLASGRRKFTKPGKGRIKMNRTTKGKRILRKGKKVKILASATFTPLRGKVVRVSRKLTVKR
jgi:hypothetical protein